MHHFDQYIYGRHVWIQSDHKPLEILLKKPLKDAPQRIQRMMLELQRYDLTVEYQKGESLYLADTLSRAYLPVTTCEYDADERICHFTTQEELTEIDARKEVDAVSDQRLVEVEEHTKKDANTCKLIDIINRGWPDKKTDIPCDLRSYFNIRDELATNNGIIFRGDHCVIPCALRKDILTKIHSAHLGITGSIRRARESVYWPGMTSDIKNFIGDCSTCNSLRTVSQPKETLLQRQRPQRPWAKVAIDLFSINTNGILHEFMVTVDYWSTFFEVDELKTTQARTVIQCLKRHFSRHGIPSCVVTDNGPQFSCSLFYDFSQQWMFEHIRTSPYHPQANGMAESAVKTAKP